jgi:hypothetical protein
MTVPPQLPPLETVLMGREGAQAAPVVVEEAGLEALKQVEEVAVLEVGLVVEQSFSIPNPTFLRRQKKFKILS